MISAERPGYLCPSYYPVLQRTYHSLGSYSFMLEYQLEHLDQQNVELLTPQGLTGKATRQKSMYGLHLVLEIRIR